MKSFKFYLTAIFALIIAATSGVVGASVGLNPYAVGGAVAAASFIPKEIGVLRSGINVEIWQNFIMDNLFKDNTFLTKSVDVSGFVINGSVVHIPNAGSPSAVARNRQNLPASIKRRKDTDITYALDSFTTDPVAILQADKVELSYDKMQSVLASDISNIKEVMAEWILYDWAKDTASGAKLKTSGGAVAAHLPGATGNRNAFVAADLKKAQKYFNKLNVPKTGRYCLLDSDMYEQFTDSLTATQYSDFSRAFNEVEGVVGKLFGFTIMERSTVLALSTAGTVKEPGVAGAATDCAGALLWHESLVEKAVGSVNSFENRADATYYGDIYSFEVRAGGRQRYGDSKGVLIIYQEQA